jgi:hypothetical protein
MRHGDIRLTMSTYTDPKLLDVHGALDALPELPLENADRTEQQRAAGTDADPTNPVSALTPMLTPMLAPNADKS